jgi:hypothetical protein
MDRWGVWVWQKGESYPSGPRHVLAAEPPHPLLTFGILLRGTCSDIPVDMVQDCVALDSRVSTWPMNDITCASGDVFYICQIKGNHAMSQVGMFQQSNLKFFPMKHAQSQQLEPLS